MSFNFNFVCECKRSISGLCSQGPRKCLVFPRALIQVPWEQMDSLGPGEKPNFTWWCGGAAPGESHPVVHLLPFFLFFNRGQSWFFAWTWKMLNLSSRTGFLAAYSYGVESIHVAHLVGFSIFKEPGSAGKCICFLEQCLAESLQGLALRLLESFLVSFPCAWLEAFPPTMASLPGATLE